MPVPHVTLVRAVVAPHKQVLDSTMTYELVAGSHLFLGKGTYCSNCFSVTLRGTCDEVACKRIPKKLAEAKPQRKIVVREAIIHRRMRHPHVVAFHGLFEDDHAYYLLSELCSGGTLTVAIGQLSQDQRRRIYRQICGAVQYMHRVGIVHRDIKPQNVLFADASLADIRVIDFGISLHRLATRITVGGTPNYMAPELLTDDAETVASRSFPLDMWSLGALMWTVAAGKSPFHSESNQATYDKIRAGIAMLCFPSACCAQERHLISALLHLQPDRRLTANEALAHPFMHAHCALTRRQMNDIPTEIMKPDGAA